MNPTTPTRISDGIRAFCGDIGPTQEPVYVPVRPVPQARINSCFLAVRDHITQNGGHIQHGWIIWELPKIFLEAEFHAVWVSPASETVDITPKIDNEDSILFLPDSKRVYEGRLVKNRRKPLVFNDFTLKWLWHEHNRHLIRQKHFRNGEVAAAVAAEELAQWMESQGEAGPPKFGRNAPCLCASGKKFKKCCLPRFEAGR
jgi:hypothetical protein